MWRASFDYGTTDNNGNVKSQTLVVPTVGSNQGFTATQTYTYDSLNRLQSAAEIIGTTPTWKQTFVYDRFGNRQFDLSNTSVPTTAQGLPKVINPEIDPSNNRLKQTQYTEANVYLYDAAGNMTKDALGKQYIYDAENKQREVKDAGNISIGKYVYDGDGKRVKKTVGLETTIFVYDALGKLAAEYSTTAPPPPNKATTSYLTTDHLGSPRVITNQSGAVTSQRDFLPFGEDLSTSQRSIGLGYAADNIREKFTGKKRDDETGLDYFGARYYSNQHGRFTNPDIPFADQIENNPQSWNLYVYSGNNPVKYLDMLGLWKSVACSSGNQSGICYEAEEGDTYESLAKTGCGDWLRGCGAGGLRDFFGNQDIAAGQVFEVTGYADWTSQEIDKQIGYAAPMEAGLGGGLRSEGGAIASGGKGFLSWAFNKAKSLLGIEGKAAATNTEAASAAQYQAMKQLFRRMMAKPPVTDPDLKAIMDKAYREAATIGSGSTAAAVRQEITTGQPVGGAWHSQKAQDLINSLERWLNRNPNASGSDRHAAEQVILDCKDALGQ